MAKIKNTKEIRITFNLDNENDKKLYDKLIEFTQPGKIIKKIVSENIYDDKLSNKKQTDSDTSIGNELILVLNKISSNMNKLSDKIDNLQIVNIQESDTKKETPEIKEISFTAEVSVDDLDDLDF